MFGFPTRWKQSEISAGWESSSYTFVYLEHCERVWHSSYGQDVDVNINSNAGLAFNMCLKRIKAVGGLTHVLQNHNLYAWGISRSEGLSIVFAVPLNSAALIVPNRSTKHQKELAGEHSTTVDQSSSSRAGKVPSGVGEDQKLELTGENIGPCWMKLRANKGQLALMMSVLFLLYSPPASFGRNAGRI